MRNSASQAFLFSMLAGTLLQVASPVGSAQAPPPNVEITKCIVYPQDQPKRSVDCVHQAQARCQATPNCELPLGLNLTDGKPMDGDPKSWKEVRVEYRCGAKEHVNGPHIQDDHATISLMCAGGF